jgi:hypothetical protein
MRDRLISLPYGVDRNAVSVIQLKGPFEKRKIVLYTCMCFFRPGAVLSGVRDPE